VAREPVERPSEESTVPDDHTGVQTCRSCGRGPLVRARLPLGGARRVLAFVLLAAGLSAAAAGWVLLAADGGTRGASTEAELAAADMRAAGVPEAEVATVLSEGGLLDRELAAHGAEARAAIDRALANLADPERNDYAADEPRSPTAGLLALGLGVALGLGAGALLRRRAAWRCAACGES
jgi:hypothetical protein